MDQNKLTIVLAWQHLHHLSITLQILRNDNGLRVARSSLMTPMPDGQ